VRDEALPLMPLTSADLPTPLKQRRALSA